MSGDRTTEGREDGGARRARPRRPRRRRATALLPQILGAAVEIDPDRDAVSFDGRALSYAELDSRSSRIARVLIGRGIGPEDVVAVGITRSMESVLALWSITKTGAAFVPVDPTYPVDRVQHMLSDSGARNGLTTSAHRGGLPDTCSWSILGDPGLFLDVVKFHLPFIDINIYLILAIFVPIDPVRRELSMEYKIVKI